MKELHWNKYNAAADLDPFPDIRYQCPVCYKSFKEEYDECPNCGLVIKRTCDNCNNVRCFIGSPGSSLCHLVERDPKEAKIDKDIVRDCHKCVYEVGCHGNPVGCKSYKRDAPDGGYYG